MNVIKVCEITIPTFLSIFIYCVYGIFYTNHESILGTCFDYVLAFLSGAFALILIDIYSLKPYGNITAFQLALKYAVIYFVRIVGIPASRRLEKATKNVQKAQETHLMQILKDNENTAYGKKHEFSKISNIEEFRQNHPITTYQHYEDYVERCINGEENVLADEPVIFIGLTSGTTGKNKRYPVFKSMGKLYMNVFGASAWYVNKKYPSYFDIRSHISARVPKRLTKTPNGLNQGPVSAMSQNKSFSKMCTTPFEATKEIYDEGTMMYIHALFGLVDRSVVKLELSFTSLARSFFHCLETNWRELCRDIELGTVSHKGIDETTRKELESSLVADPERAAELRKEFQKGMKDIAPRVWPHLQFVPMLCSGPLAFQAKSLQRRFLGNAKVLSFVHISTEGMYGLNLDPGSVETNVYTLLVDNTFFEFIPLDSTEKDQPDTKLASEVEIGESYEIVISNTYGLYRYRSGDVVRIVSFYNEAAQYEFCFRLGQMLNVHGERSTESHVQNAIENTLATFNDVELVDYTTVESSYLDDIPELKQENKLRYYVLFIEVDNDYVISDEDKEKFDEELGKQNEWYAEARRENKIEPLIVIQIEKTGFLSLKQVVLKENPGAASAQYKQPRVTRKPTLLKILSDSRLK